MKAYLTECQEYLVQIAQCEAGYKDYLSNQTPQQHDHDDVNIESQIKSCAQEYSKLLQKYAHTKSANKLEINYDSNTIKSTLTNLLTISSTSKNTANLNKHNDAKLCRFSKEFITLPEGAKLSDERTYLDLSYIKQDRCHHYVTLDSKTGYCKNDDINRNRNGKHC